MNLKTYRLFKACGIITNAENVFGQLLLGSICRIKCNVMEYKIIIWHIEYKKKYFQKDCSKKQLQHKVLCTTYTDIPENSIVRFIRIVSAPIRRAQLVAKIFYHAQFIAATIFCVVNSSWCQFMILKMFLKSMMIYFF